MSALDGSLASTSWKVRRLGAISVAVGVMFSGVLINPFNPQQTTKLVFADLFLIFGIGLFLLSSINRHGVMTLKLHLRTQGVLLVLGTFLVWMFLSGVIAVFRYDQPMSALFVTVGNYLYGGVIAVAIAAISAEARHSQLLILAYAIGVALVAVFSAMAMFGQAPDWAYHGGGRIKSTSQSVNQLAAFVAPAVPLLLILSLRAATTRLHTVVYIAITVLAVIALLGTGSRTALALLVFSALLTLMATVLFWNSRSLFAATVVGSATVAGGALIFIANAFTAGGSGVLPASLQALARPLERFISPNSIEAGLGPRYDQIMAVWNNWTEHPVFGVGPGNFKKFMYSEYEVHNTYLGTLIEVGVPGLLLLLLFQVLIFLMAIRVSFGTHPGDRRILVFGLAAAFLIVCLYGLGSFGLRQRPFWILAGLALGAMNWVWLHPEPRNRTQVLCLA